MDGPETDEDLVRRFQDGSDAGALDTLVERHQSRVYNLCLRVLGDPDEAADASQDAFVSAIRKLHTFRGEAAFTTWLHRVTVNTCYDSLRRKRRRPLLHVLDDEGEERPDPAPPVPDHAERVGLSIDVERALRTVPDEFRVVLVMADVEDLPYDRIADILQIPVGTVKSRVFRGRAALGRALGVGEPADRSRTSEEQA
ncbi:MAG TPA: sigma-70 family RNA polymerase sigma factor [Actinomycetota bacterium]|nr:sigma-70 family RNA polymerase sigma factor [Actinomycetota bacterium]